MQSLIAFGAGGVTGVITHDPEIGRRTARQVGMQDGRVIADGAGAKVGR